MKINDERIEKRIYQKTAELIGRQGIRGWSMDRLAEASGLAKNTLYKIIGTKENLLLRVILSSIEEVQAQLADIMVSEPSYVLALERMTALFPALLGGLDTGIMREIFLEYPALETQVQAHQDALTRRIIAFFARGIDGGFFSAALDPAHVFELFQAAVLYYIKKELSAAERSVRLEQAIRVLLRGMRAGEDI